MKLKPFAALALGTSLLFAESDAPKRLEVAAEDFKEVMGIPEKSIPQELLNKAQCIVIVPGLKKGAFIFGAKYGKGFVCCRKKSGVGWWGPGSVLLRGGGGRLRPEAGGGGPPVFLGGEKREGKTRPPPHNFPEKKPRPRPAYT